MSKTRTGPARIILYALIIIAAIALIAVIAVNAIVRIAFAGFYDEAAPEFQTPGIAEGFIPQDLSPVEGGSLWLFSGYYSNESPSPIYRHDAANGSDSRVFVELPDGESYTGHGGGIASDGKWVYLTYESGYLAIPLEDVLEAPDDGTARASGFVETEFTPAFVNICDGKLYLGNFYYEGKYDSPSKMWIQSGDGTDNHAVMYEFAPDESEPYGYSTVPQTVYSIPDKVQGVCIDDGRFVLSTSWGISPSHLPVYDGATLPDGGTYRYSLKSIAEDNADTGSDIADESETVHADNAVEAAQKSAGDYVEVPLKLFSNAALLQDISAPPMTEGISLCGDRIYIANESASSKYIFGKLYGGSTVYSIEVSNRG